MNVIFYGDPKMTFKPSFPIYFLIKCSLTKICFEMLPDNYNCRELLPDSYNSHELLRDSYNCRELLPDSKFVASSGFPILFCETILL